MVEAPSQEARAVANPIVVQEILRELEDAVAAAVERAVRRLAEVPDLDPALAADLVTRSARSAGPTR